MQHISTETQIKHLEELAALVEMRARDEAEIKSRYEADTSAEMERYETEKSLVTTRFKNEHDTLETTYVNKLSGARHQYEADSMALKRKQEAFKQQAEDEHKSRRRREERKWQATRAQANERCASGKESAERDCQQAQQSCEQYRGQIHGLDQEARKLLKRRGCKPGDDERRWRTEDEHRQPMDQYSAAIQAGHQALQRMLAVKPSKFLDDGWPIMILVFTAMAVAAGGIYLWGWNNWYGIASGFAVASVTYVVIRSVVGARSKSQTLAHFPALQEALCEAHAALDQVIRDAGADRDRRVLALEEARDKQVREADQTWENSASEMDFAHAAKLKQHVEDNESLLKEYKRTWEAKTKAYNEEFRPRLKEIEQQFEVDRAEFEKRHEENVARIEAQFRSDWNDLESRWLNGMHEFQSAIAEMNDYCEQRFPAWDQVDWDQWRPSSEPVPAIPFGSHEFALEMLDHGLPEDASLTPSQTEFQIPAVLTYPERPSLLLEAFDDGRDAAVQALQNVMLRMITSLPPGKVRFTIIDPIGLGQNFSAFMHLADFDERLVNSRIWTEQSHINQRLADLTEHMENVIQKYLRNEFQSIQQYNQHAGEVAEAFQVLVVANFPNNFSEEAARRLVSIATSGARCGVYTLISTDVKMKMPRNFDPADLEASAAVLLWNGERFTQKQDELSTLPLVMAAKPADDVFTEAVKAVGRFAKDANRVEVPFRTVVPPPDRWWSWDSRDEIEVPLGRAGATKLQYLRLGKGTSQHVLMAGKTGSGKSTLLHALITNLATHYSPHEINFYLIDFKKGVEFKAYATFALPHACVIAIESEREFGLSVLERLDQELKQRGDLFRSQGVQGISGFRNANPATVMPRILLIIDEFQELFVKDDRIAQESSLLLDRLVRQGRAFGIHVLLGSQTLAGAYSLARSTIGQMAVRIALQCSDADAHLILSDENTAARLLSRPGEAIYNDANGMFEGNHPFQVVWLPDNQKEEYLQQVRQKVREREMDCPPAIVFEGNVAADPQDNQPLKKQLAAPSVEHATASPRAWLGSAVSIKEPTAAVFGRHSGAYLLGVVQQEEMALGVLANCLVSLSAELIHANGDGRLGGARFYVLDGSRPDSFEAGFWNRLAKRLPVDVEVGDNRRAAAILAELAGLVQQRLDNDAAPSAPVFLVIHNLARFRDLKKSEDFSFSFDDKEGSAESPDKQLQMILREGPSVGVHALIWCDSYNNVARWFERQALNDLELRVLFQMSATDSSNLMDTPAASNLGVHRAIFYSDEKGEFEKFRPYGVPENEWLDWVHSQLQSRATSASTNA